MACNCLQRGWDSNRVTRAVKTAFILGCGQVISIQSWRQISTAIRKRYLSEVSSLTTQLSWHSDSDSSRSDDEPDSSQKYSRAPGPGPGRLGPLWSGQTTHSARTDRDVYGRLAEGNKPTYRTISLIWHRFYGLQEERESEMLLTRKRRAQSTFED